MNIKTFIGDNKVGPYQKSAPFYAAMLKKGYKPQPAAYEDPKWPSLSAPSMRLLPGYIRCRSRGRLGWDYVVVEWIPRK